MSSTLTRSTSSSPDLGDGGRSLGSRFSPGVALMVAAALLAGITNFAVLRGADDRVAVVVAARDLTVGAPLVAEDLGTLRVGLDDATDAGLVAGSMLTSLLGEVPAVAVPAGAAVRPGDLRPAAADSGLRRMSLPVAPERAVGGAVSAGDRIDVLAVVGDQSAQYLVTDITVLAVAARDGAVLAGASGPFTVTLAVDAEQARCLATALATAELTVVLSTGTEALAADGCGALVPGAGGAVTRDEAAGTDGEDEPAAEPDEPVEAEEPVAPPATDAAPNEPAPTDAAPTDPAAPGTEDA